MRFYYRNVYADGMRGLICASKADTKRCRSGVRTWIGVNIIVRDSRTGTYVTVFFDPA